MGRRGNCDAGRRSLGSIEMSRFCAIWVLRRTRLVRGVVLVWLTRSHARGRVS